MASVLVIIYAIDSALAISAQCSHDDGMRDLAAPPLIFDAVPSVRADVLDAAQRAMSANSWRALRADLKLFSQWAGDNALTSLPASPETVARFLRDQAEAGKKAEAAC